MGYDWRTIIHTSSGSDGWANVNISGSPQVNRVRDVIMLPYGEHKSIAIWLQETSGIVIGTAPNAEIWPSLRILAAIIDQTRTIESTLSASSKYTIGEATSVTSPGTRIVEPYGPLQAVKLREDYAGNAAFLVSFDWRTRDSAGATQTSAHQLFYMTVTGSTLALAQVYTDPSQGTNSPTTSLLANAGDGRAVWFKSKAGGAQHTAKVITAALGDTTMTMSGDQDLPTEVTNLDGYLAWQGDTFGFIHNAPDALSSLVLPYSLPVGTTGMSWGSAIHIQRGVNNFVKLLPGQRIESLGGNTFIAVGIQETFTGPNNQNLDASIYGASVVYDVGESYDDPPSAVPLSPLAVADTFDSSTLAYDSSTTQYAEGAQLAGTSIATGLEYSPSSIYDTSQSYDATNFTDGHVFDSYPQVFRISFNGSAFSIDGESVRGQLYRLDATPAEDVVIGTGSTLQASYHATSMGTNVSVVDSSHDAVAPVSATRFFGQEVQFDVIGGAVRSTYPSTISPFSGKYGTNTDPIDVGLALARSGAFAAYIASSPTGGTTLDRPLRISYFENQFVPTTTEAFPGDDGNHDHVGTVTDPNELIIEDRFGHTTPGHMLCLDADIDLNGIILNRLDTDGILWVCTGVDGWWNMPEPTFNEVQRGQIDGNYSTEGRYSGRVFTINGVFIPADRAGVLNARDRLFRAINIVHGTGYFRTQDDAFKREAEIYLSGKPEIDTVNQKGRTEFSITFKAPDPIKYENVSLNPEMNFRSMASTIASGTAFNGRVYPKTYDFSYTYDVNNPTGSINVTNYGNYLVSPTIIVSGPLEANALLINKTTNETINIVDAVTASQTLTIDVHERQVFLNGQPNFRSKLSIDSEWIHLQPGTNVIAFVGTNTGGSTTAPPRMTVQWRSGWIG